MSEILDDMFDEALRFEQDSDEHCGEVVIQSSEFCALHARIRELEALVENCHRKLSEYIIPCLNCDDGIDEAVCTCAEPRHEFERLLEVIKALEPQQ